ncbi:MAG: hypothetical protein D6732_07060 [Methanobacteriota archaeon]|nr:MAG: hypothetical protein D6732_07060 [Euryarchaeota archaeon]
MKAYVVVLVLMLFFSQFLPIGVQGQNGGNEAFFSFQNDFFPIHSKLEFANSLNDPFIPFIHHVSPDTQFFVGTYNPETHMDFGSFIRSSPLSPLAGGLDILISQFDKTRFTWFRYFGGSGNETLFDVVGLPDSSILITGLTDSPDLPVNSSSYSGGTDLFFAKISSEGNITQSSYWGGSGNESIHDVFFDETKQEIHIVGSTNSDDFPLVNPTDTFLNGSADGFILTISVDGNVKTSTFIGGDGFDSIEQVAIFNQSVILTGLSNSTVISQTDLKNFIFEYNPSINSVSLENASVLPLLDSPMWMDEIDDNLILLSYSNRNPSNGQTTSNSDIHLLTINKSLDIIDYNQYGSIGDEYISDAVFLNDQIYILGHSSNNIRFNSDDGYGFETNDASSIYLLILNSSGISVSNNLLWSNGVDLPFNLEIYQNDVFITGLTTGANFPNGDGSLLETPISFVMRLYNPIGDEDGDGLSNQKEYRLFSNPFISDSDQDGLSDYDEFNLGLLLNSSDTDQDGLDDFFEHSRGIDPLNPDTDHDGISDKDEVLLYFTNPLINDTDGDGWSDGYELLTSKTSPLKADTDGDGIQDSLEPKLGLNPLQNEKRIQFWLINLFGVPILLIGVKIGLFISNLIRNKRKQ